MEAGKAIAAVLVLALAACDSYPRDVSGTSDRLESSGVLRAGLAELDPRQAAVARRYVARVATAAGVRAEWRAAESTEGLLARLEDGELDLVMAEVSDDSPWVSHVAVLDPLMARRAGERRMAVRPVARNGENAFIGFLEREARDMAAGQ